VRSGNGLELYLRSRNLPRTKFTGDHFNADITLLPLRNLPRAFTFLASYNMISPYSLCAHVTRVDPMQVVTPSRNNEQWDLFRRATVS